MEITNSEKKSCVCPDSWLISGGVLSASLRRLREDITHASGNIRAAISWSTVSAIASVAFGHHALCEESGRYRQNNHDVGQSHPSSQQNLLKGILSDKYAKQYDYVNVRV